MLPLCRAKVGHPKSSLPDHVIYPAKEDQVAAEPSVIKYIKDDVEEVQAEAEAPVSA